MCLYTYMYIVIYFFDNQLHIHIFMICVYSLFFLVDTWDMFANTWKISVST